MINSFACLIKIAEEMSERKITVSDGYYSDWYCSKLRSHWKTYFIIQGTKSLKLNEKYFHDKLKVRITIIFSFSSWCTAIMAIMILEMTRNTQTSKNCFIQYVGVPVIINSFFSNIKFFDCLFIHILNIIVYILHYFQNLFQQTINLIPIIYDIRL